MPDGERFSRQAGKLPEGKKTADLSAEEIAALNAKRSPADRVKATAVCGAKLTDKAIQRKRETAKGGKVEITCQAQAGMGTSHPGIGYCKFHGGNTPAGAKSAARVYGQSLIEEERRALVESKFGGDRALLNITPEEALLEEIRRSVALVRWLEERISRWTYEDITVEDDDPRLDPAHEKFDPKYRTPQPKLGGLPSLIEETYKGNPINTNEREWLDLYRREREHAVRVSKLAIDAGIAKRMVSIAEDQGRMLAVAIRYVLEALDLTPKQIEMVPRVVPAILRQVSQGLKPQGLSDGLVAVR